MNFGCHQLYFPARVSADAQQWLAVKEQGRAVLSSRKTSKDTHELKVEHCLTRIDNTTCSVSVCLSREREHINVFHHSWFFCLSITKVYGVWSPVMFTSIRRRLCYRMLHTLLPNFIGKKYWNIYIFFPNSLGKTVINIEQANPTGFININPSVLQYEKKMFKEIQSGKINRSSESGACWALLII